MSRTETDNQENLNRREALSQTGKYAAFTAAAMMQVLTPKASLAQVATSYNPAYAPDNQTRPASRPSTPQE